MLVASVAVMMVLETNSGDTTGVGNKDTRDVKGGLGKGCFGVVEFIGADT